MLPRPLAPPIPRAFRLQLWTAAVLLVGCEEAFEPATPAPPAQLQAVGPGTEVTQSVRPGDIKLIAPSEQQFVIELAPGTDIDHFIEDHELTLLERKDGLLLVAGAESDTWLDTLPGVASASTNRPVNLSEGQDLVFGFDEGSWDPEGNAGQDAFAGLELSKVHALGQGAGVIVAVLDTGADLEHAHLAGSVMALSDEEVLFSTEMGNRIDDDDDDLIDEAFGHGTHVAGIVHTVAPRAILLPIRVLNDDGVGSLWDLILGLQLAHEYGATVVNLSLSLSGYSEFFEHALSKLDQAGISLVGAAGNHGWQDPVYPATSPLVLGVAALDTVEAVAAFSGAGPLISVAAPGTSVMSSYPGDLMVGGTGTSMATPIVSGTIAIVRECGNSAPEAQQIVCETAVVVLPEAYAPKYGRVVPLEAAKRKGNG